jgi:AcrR family transcriptional regulator
MTSAKRRNDTRERIKEVALALFLEQGYDKSSLREIAEALDVTKAALYYHFRTKEEILIELCKEYLDAVEEIVAWAREMPRDRETRQELLRRYCAMVLRTRPLFVFLQENQVSLRQHSVGIAFRGRLTAMSELITDPDAPVAERVRSTSALLAVHFGVLALPTIEGDEDEKVQALLDVAIGLLPHPAGATTH